MLVGRHPLAVAAILLLSAFSTAIVGATEDLVAHWKDLLAGTKLVIESRTSSGAAGASAKTTWNLCRNGSFHSAHSSTASVENSGSLSLSTNQVTHAGRWSVETHEQDAVLMLVQRDGQRVTYRLTSDGQTTCLDGEPVIQMRSRICP